jgi:outer membrane protein OmpA-like peptidoglycan-associated protein
MLRFGRASIPAVTAAALVLAVSADPASAQRAPALGGAEVRLGLTFPEQANVGGSILGEVDLGYLFTPPLRLLVGLSVYEANIDRLGGGDEGFFRATGLWTTARYDLETRRTLAPYLRAGLTLQRVRADAFAREVQDLLPGTYLGATGGVGIRYLLDHLGRLSATAELRRNLLSNISSTALEVGVRLQRDGFGAYVPAMPTVAVRPAPAPVLPPAAPPAADPAPPAPPLAPAPTRDTAAERRLAELERLVAETERAVAEARAAAPRAAPPTRPDPDPDRERAAADAMLRQSLHRAAAAMATVTDLVEGPDAFVLTISGGAFPSGAATLAAPARDETRVLATVLGGYPGRIIAVQGHTDSVGDPVANQTLSERRAAAVRAALIAEGVDPLWISSQGFGESRPVASNQTTAGRAANRRVEVRISREVCPTAPLPGPGGVLECRL